MNRPDFHSLVPPAPIIANTSSGEPSALPPETGRQAAHPIKTHVDPRTVQLWREAGIPLRHVKTTVDWAGNPSWSCQTRKMLACFKQRPDAMFSLIGPNGTGKTQAAVELIRVAVADGHPCLYQTATDIFRHVKSAYSNDEPEARAMRKFVAPTVLILDEIHVRKMESEWESNILTDLIDRRYNAMKCTLMASNLDVDSFRDCVGDSIYSRLTHTGGFLLYEGPSFRARD